MDEIMEMDMAEGKWEPKQEKIWEPEISLFEPGEASSCTLRWSESGNKTSPVAENDQKFFATKTCLNCSKPCGLPSSEQPNLPRTESSAMAGQKTGDLTGKMTEISHTTDVIYVDDDPVKISFILETFYKCEDWEDGLTLCSICCDALADLFKMYKTFENLRSINSYLFKKLQQFEMQLQSTSNKRLSSFQSVTSSGDGGDDDYDYSSNFDRESNCSSENVASGGAGDYSANSPDLSKKLRSNFYSDPKLHPAFKGPWVRVNRVTVPTKSENSKTKKKDRTGRDLKKSYFRKKAKYPNPCWYCKKFFDTSEQCVEHTRSVHFDSSSDAVLCNTCGKISTSDRKFRAHEVRCAAYQPGKIVAPYACTECPKGFAFKAELESHLLSHAEKGGFPCTLCSFNTKSDLHLKRHMAKKHTEKPATEGPPQIYQCEHCPKTLSSLSNLKLHVTNMHTEEGRKRYKEQQRKILDKQKEERRKRIENRTYVCDLCQVDCFNQYMLVTHKKTFHPTEVAKKFVCDQCGKDFSRNYSLKYHIRHAHTDERPFVCEHCGKDFKTNTNLQAHVARTHSEEGRLQYNAFMREHNQRRKLMKQAMAMTTRENPEESREIPSPPTLQFHTLHIPGLNGQPDITMNLLN